MKKKTKEKLKEKIEDYIGMLYGSMLVFALVHCFFTDGDWRLSIPATLITLAACFIMDLGVIVISNIKRKAKHD